MTDSSHKKDDVSMVFEAADDIVNLLIPQYSLAGKINAQAIVAAAAAITGEWGLLSLELDLPESGFVHSDEIDKVLVLGEGAVWHLIEKSAVQAGVANIQLPNVSAAIARNAAAIGTGPYPPLSVPEKHFPDEWTPHACPRYRNNVAAIATRHHLDNCEMVFACGIATAKLIVQTADTIDPTITTQLALEMMIGVSRLVPLNLENHPVDINQMVGANDNTVARTTLHLVDI